MVNGNYIVAIDFGGSRFQGMIGRKNAEGMLGIVARESEDSKKFMCRGRITNLEDASMCISKIVKKLENAANKGKTPDDKIKVKRIYVGVYGQSIHSIEHSVARIIRESRVAEDDVQVLNEQCRTHAANMSEDAKVYAILPPVYYLDDRIIGNPLGAMCTQQLKASYQLIVGWPSIDTLARQAVKKTGYDLAGILVSPISLAEALLDYEEKKAGSILIHLDFGVTTIAVYKDCSLAFFATVPFGDGLITKDLSKELDLSEAHAEELKNGYVNLAADGNRASSGSIEYIIDGKKIDRYRADMIAGARAREIVENVYSLVKSETQSRSFAGSIKLTGEASELKGMAELIATRFKLNVVRTDIPGEWNGAAGKDDLMAVGLLAGASENCVEFARPVAPQPTATDGTSGTTGNRNGSDVTGTAGGFDDSRSKKSLKDRLKDMFEGV
ncbi:MAG: hypothetical protein LBJ23_00610 [Tannerella sp.]|jgi:cell division protein FtsA|nr:hypothetical protein [Tannerella sp.]